jgi:hypothetical protein
MLFFLVNPQLIHIFGLEEATNQISLGGKIGMINPKKMLKDVGSWGHFL